MYMETSQSLKTISVSSSNSIPVKLTPMDSTQVDEVTKLEKKVAVNCSRKRNIRGSRVQSPAAGSWQMSVEMGVYKNRGNKNNSVTNSSEVKGFARVRDRGSQGILDRLCHVYREGEVKLTLKIENIKTFFHDKPRGDWPYEMNIIEEDAMYISELTSYGVEKAELNIGGDGIYAMLDWKDIFTSNFKVEEKEACLTIIAVVPDPSPEIGSSVPDKFCLIKKVLIEEICTDAIIIAENGVGVKCHKAHLAVHSSVFATMFQTDMQESKTNIVEMPDMSEAGVRAFLAYLYYWETEEADKDSLVCFELLAAGHKYDIGQLENCMQEVLLGKSKNWYDVDVAMKLFLFSRNLPAGESLKTKALEVLKLKRTRLENCPAYQQLFTDDPRAAMELCNTFLRSMNT